MAGLAHDGELPGTIQVRLGGEAGAQGVAGIVGGIEAGRLGGSFYDQADGVFVQAKPVAVCQAVSARTGQVDGVEP